MNNYFDFEKFMNNKIQDSYNDGFTFIWKIWFKIVRTKSSYKQLIIFFL
jgi:hypothetical protein